MKKGPATYGTMAVHLQAPVIAKIDEIAAQQERSRSWVLGKIITRELGIAPEPQIRFARRAPVKPAKISP